MRCGSRRRRFATSCLARVALLRGQRRARSASIFLPRPMPTPCRLPCSSWLRAIPPRPTRSSGCCEVRLARDGTHPDAVAEAYWQMGRLANRQAWREVSGSALQQRMAALAQSGDFEAAVALAPLSERYVVEAANQADLLGDRRRAAELFAQPLTVDPASADAIAGLGVVGLENGRPANRGRRFGAGTRARSARADGSRARTRLAVRVALDAQLTVGTATGIGEYVRGLIEAAAAATASRLVELRETAARSLAIRSSRAVGPGHFAAARARSSGAQLLHCAAGTMPLVAGMPIVVTVHDLAWHEAQAHAPAYARYYFGPFSLNRYRSAARHRRRLELFARQAAAARATSIRRASTSSIRALRTISAALREAPATARTILAVGTVERRKNLEVLIRALAHLPGARLVAIGPRTPYAQECAQLAQRLRVADRVEMPGYVPREQLLALYERCAVAAVPSRYEGFGYAAAQALCAGVPCVVSDRTSLPGGRAPATRPVVDADDPNAWAACARRGLERPRGRSAHDRRAAAIARFSWADERATHREGLRFLSRSVSRVRPGATLPSSGAKMRRSGRLEPASGIVTIVTRTNPCAGTIYCRTL